MRILISILAAMSLLMVSLSSFAIKTQGMKITIYNATDKHMLVKEGDNKNIKHIRPKSHVSLTHECKVPKNITEYNSCKYIYEVYPKGTQGASCTFTVKFRANAVFGATDAKSKGHGVELKCSSEVAHTSAGPGSKVEVSATVSSR